MSDIPQTSRAACVVAFKEPVEIRQVPMPHDIEPGAMLVQTEVASICGSDVHLWQGELGVASRLQLPIILGHEMMGRVVRLGPGVSTDIAHRRFYHCGVLLCRRNVARESHSLSPAPARFSPQARRQWGLDHGNRG